MKYRKKLIVEAIQWNGKNIDEVIDFVDFFFPHSWRLDKLLSMGMKIFFPHPIMHASVGDYIVKQDGAVFRCNPIKFAETYESIE